jgi:2-polyprenyl-3-methyl-5-hydroxy-6-metoxy-1,4-benzoquinol methylase
MKLTDNTVESLRHFLDYMVPRDSCNLCGSTERTEWAKASPITAYQCSHCGLVYHDLQLTDEGRNVFYASGYFELQNDPSDAEKRDRMYGVEIGFLEKHISGGKILDVGCGGGFLLNQFGDTWEKHGIEFDAKAVDHANNELNLSVQCGEVNTVTFPDNNFDAIVLRGVIEHFAEPAVMMKHLIPWLKKDGYLYITSTPNAESLCAELYREKWNLFTADHQIHFPKQTIIDFVETLGCTVVDSAYFYLETPYANEREDYRKILADSERIYSGRRDEVTTSPAFYGNMLSLIFKKT